MPIRVRPMTKAEEEASSGGNPVLEEGRYYKGVVRYVGFFRNGEGFIVGSPPSRPREEGGVRKSRYPFGQMRLAIKVDLEGIDKQLTIGCPLPWDTTKPEARPWDGPLDANRLPVFETIEGRERAVGKPRLFVDADVEKYALPVKTGTMKHKIAGIAEAFGWQPFSIEPDGTVVPQSFDLEELLLGKSVFVGKVKIPNSTFYDFDIKPCKARQKSSKMLLTQMLAALINVKMRNGQPFTLSNVIAALHSRPGLETISADRELTNPEMKIINDVLKQSCVDNGIIPPSEDEDEVEKPSGL